MDDVGTERNRWQNGQLGNGGDWGPFVDNARANRWGLGGNGYAHQLTARRESEPLHVAGVSRHRGDEYSLLVDQVRKARLLVSGIFLVLAALSFIPIFLDRDVQLTALLGLVIFLAGALVRFYASYRGPGSGRWGTSSAVRRRARTARRQANGWRWRVALETPPRHLLSPQELRYIQIMQRLSLVDRDFTPQDYELLLELDSGAAAMQEFLHGAPQDAIDLLPCFTYKEWMQRGSATSESKRSKLMDNHENLTTRTEAASPTEPTTAGAHAEPAATQTDTASLLKPAETADSDANKPASSSCKLQSEEERTEPDDTTSVCVVCLDFFLPEERIRVLPCLHQYHQQCIDPWLRQKARCPVCKSAIL